MNSGRWWWTGRPGVLWFVGSQRVGHDWATELNWTEHAKAETPVLWPPHAKSWLIGKDSDAGKDWRQKEKGKEWDGWMASLTRWTWVWVNSGRWWWTGRPGMLWFMGSQRLGHDWVTELNWTSFKFIGLLKNEHAFKQIKALLFILAVLGLHGCAQAFSSCREQWLLSSRGVQA